MLKTFDVDSPRVQNLIRRSAEQSGLSAPPLDYDPTSKNWKELHETRKSARKLARELIDSAETASDDEARAMEAAHDGLMSVIDTVTEEIENRDMAGTKDPIQPDPRRPVMPDMVAGVGQEPSTAWRDSRTGAEIRTLGKRDRFADLVERPRDGLSLGHCLRAMITGPRSEAEQRALSEGTDSAGGFTVPDQLLGRFIDKLRARTVVMAAGAQTVPMTSDTLSIAKLTGDPTATWHAENAAEGTSDATFGAVDFQARTLMSMVRASRELIQDSANAEEALEAAFAGALSVELDRAALLGAGGDEPNGLSGATGVNQVEMGTDGAAPSDFNELLDLYQAILDDNAEPPNGAIMAPRTQVQYAKLQDANNQPLQRPALISDLPFRSTTSVPTDQTQGTADNASTLFLGDWSRMLIGMRSALRVELLRERYAENYQFGFLAHMRADVQLEHGESFGELVGITP